MNALSKRQFLKLSLASGVALSLSACGGGDEHDIGDVRSDYPEDGLLGEAVQAAVQLRPGYDVSDSDLIAFVRERLGPVQTPKRIYFYESLPRSPVGKVLKSAVRELALAKE